MDDCGYPCAIHHLAHASFLGGGFNVHDLRCVSRGDHTESRDSPL